MSFRALRHIVLGNPFKAECSRILFWDAAQHSTNCMLWFISVHSGGELQYRCILVVNYGHFATHMWFTMLYCNSLVWTSPNAWILMHICGCQHSHLKKLSYACMFLCNTFRAALHTKNAQKKYMTLCTLLPCILARAEEYGSARTSKVLGGINNWWHCHTTAKVLCVFAHFGNAHFPAMHKYEPNIREGGDQGSLRRRGEV